MREKVINSREAGFYAYAAVRNASFRNSVNKSLYSEALKVQAIRIKDALEQCYVCNGIHVNYRKKYIAIKVDKPTDFRDRKGLRLLEAAWVKDGITKVCSKQGTIYRIPNINRLQAAQQMVV